MKTIVCINEKGGVGKTTVAVTAAAGLAARGYRVLLIDTDEQGHVATSLGLEKAPGLFNLLEMQVSWRDVCLQIKPEQFMQPGRALMSSTGTLLIVPSDTRTRALPFTMRPDAMVLNQRLQQLASALDFVIIDTAPAASLIHLLIYSAADYAIYPTKTEYLSFDGLIEALSHLEGANSVRQGKGLPAVQVAGIIPNMFRKATLEHRENLKMLQEHYGDLVWQPVAERAVWTEALSSVSGYTPVYAHAPGSEAAREAWEIVNRIEMLVMGEVKHEQSA
ncbi:MAG: ParA family protein [Anaerolineae bacterium]|nr:ParA family protein [Anaerolineae bacterium]